MSAVDDARARRRPGLVRRYPALVASGIVVAALFATVWWLPLPASPTALDPFSVLQAPSAEHWFGTDANGSDVFSRVVAAGRLDMSLALAAALIAGLIGVPVGIVASARTRVAGAIVRSLDLFQSFPLILVAIIVVALMGNSIRTVVLALILVLVPQFIRLVRADALVVQETRYVEAARSLGASSTRITFVHVLPNVIGTVVTQFSLAVSTGTVAIAALTFIGIGVTPPTPSWGGMIRAGAGSIASGQWWVALTPGAALLAWVAAFNVFARAASLAFTEDHR